MGDEQVAKKNALRQATPIAREWFQALDSDSSGFVTIEEIKKHIEDGNQLPGVLAELLSTNDIVELFETIDDGDGCLAEAEFVEGLIESAMSDIPVELAQILKLLRSQRHAIRKISSALSRDGS